jgi:hypothetical protein
MVDYTPCNNNVCTLRRQNQIAEKMLYSYMVVGTSIIPIVITYPAECCAADVVAAAVSISTGYTDGILVSFSHLTTVSFRSD